MNKIIETEDHFEIFIDGQGYIITKPIINEDLKNLFYEVWKAGVSDAASLYETEEYCKTHRQVERYCQQENPWK